MARLSCNGSLQFLWFRNLVVVISFPGDRGGLVKIKGRRRRGGFPFETSGSPGIVTGERSVAQRPEQVDHGQQITYREDAGAGRREHVQHLKLRRVLPVAARHPKVAENKLRKEGQVETDEHKQRRQLSPSFGIHASGHLRPPEVQTSEVANKHPTNQ